MEMNAIAFQVRRRGFELDEGTVYCEQHFGQPVAVPSNNYVCPLAGEAAP